MKEGVSLPQVCFAQPTPQEREKVSNRLPNRKDVEEHTEIRPERGGFSLVYLHLPSLKPLFAGAPIHKTPDCDCFGQSFSTFSTRSDAERRK